MDGKTGWQRFEILCVLMYKTKGLNGRTEMLITHIIHIYKCTTQKWSQTVHLQNLNISLKNKNTSSKYQVRFNKDQLSKLDAFFKEKKNK